jgi:hypothetical protein
MTFDVRTTDLTKLNSLTKYPSIPTYHTLDPKNGGLIEETVSFAGTVLGTEKVDGTNSRILCLPDGNFLLGSREELLYAKGDLIGNPALGIVDALKPLAERLPPIGTDTITVYYLEVYGGKVTAASKQYTGEMRVAYRLFDVVQIPDYASRLLQSPQEIANWRDHSGQAFVTESELNAIASQSGIELTPRLFTLPASDLPQSIEEMVAFLKKSLPESRSALDEQAGGRPEGIVLRTLDRATIAKARFEDYERTLKRRK